MIGLGSCRKLGLAEAREEWRKMLLQVAQGKDPKVERQQKSEPVPFEQLVAVAALSVTSIAADALINAPEHLNGRVEEPTLVGQRREHRRSNRQCFGADNIHHGSIRHAATAMLGSKLFDEAPHCLVEVLAHRSCSGVGGGNVMVTS